MRAVAIWIGVFAVTLTPIIAAAFSPFLAWREPIYIAAGFAGIVGMALLVVQPLLIGGYLPGVHLLKARYFHRWVGVLLLLCVVAHVAGLWVTSPPDVIDALLFVSPTPFAVWGVIAMWAVFATVVLTFLRKKFRPKIWRTGHFVLGCMVALGTVLHAVLIEGTMEPMTKYVLAFFVLVLVIKIGFDRRIIKLRR